MTVLQATRPSHQTKAMNMLETCLTSRMQPRQNVAKGFSGVAVWNGHPDPGPLTGRTAVGTRTDTSMREGIGSAVVPG